MKHRHISMSKESSASRSQTTHDFKDAELMTMVMKFVYARSSRLPALMKFGEGSYHRLDQPVATRGFARNRRSHTTMWKTSKTTEAKVEEENSCQEGGARSRRCRGCGPVDFGTPMAGRLDRRGVLGYTRKSASHKHSTSPQRQPLRHNATHARTSWRSDSRVIRRNSFT